MEGGATIQLLKQTCQIHLLKRKIQLGHVVGNFKLNLFLQKNYGIWLRNGNSSPWSVHPIGVVISNCKDFPFLFFFENLTPCHFLLNSKFCMKCRMHSYEHGVKKRKWGTWTCDEEEMSDQSFTYNKGHLHKQRYLELFRAPCIGPSPCSPP